MSTPKSEKTAIEPPKTTIYRLNLTFSGHINRIFDDNDLIYFYNLGSVSPSARSIKHKSVSPFLAFKNQYLFNDLIHSIIITRKSLSPL